MSGSKVPKQHPVSKSSNVLETDLPHAKTARIKDTVPKRIAPAKVTQKASTKNRTESKSTAMITQKASIKNTVKVKNGIKSKTVVKNETPIVQKTVIGAHSSDSTPGSTKALPKSAGVAKAIPKPEEEPKEEPEEEPKEESERECKEESEEASTKIVEHSKPNYSITDIRNTIFEDIDDEFARGKLGPIEIIIMKSNGYINGGRLCSLSKKSFRDWYRNKNTKSLVKYFKKLMGPNVECIISVNDRHNNVKGTYLHPILTTNIAHWISPTFAIELGMWIEEWKNYSENNFRRYYGGLSKLDNYDNAQKERAVQQTLLKKLGGKIEVKTNAGYIDLLTKDSLIEIKCYDDWKAGIGQLVAYSHGYKNIKRILYLFDINDNYDYNYIQEICDNNDIILQRHEAIGILPQKKR